MIGTQSANYYVEYLLNAGIIIYSAYVLSMYSWRQRIDIYIVNYELLNNVYREVRFMEGLEGMVEGWD